VSAFFSCGLLDDLADAIGLMAHDDGDVMAGDT
jgi:hypothetical protein